MTKVHNNQIKSSTSSIDWRQVMESLPKTAWQLLKDIQRAYEANTEEPAREVELGLREKLASLRRQFDAIKKESAK